jgi:hypothetical protein
MKGLLEPGPRSHHPSNGIARASSRLVVRAIVLRGQLTVNLSPPAGPHEQAPLTRPHATHMLTPTAMRSAGTVRPNRSHARADGPWSERSGGFPVPRQPREQLSPWLRHSLVTVRPATQRILGSKVNAPRAEQPWRPKSLSTSASSGHSATPTPGPRSSRPRCLRVGGPHWRSQRSSSSADLQTRFAPRPPAPCRPSSPTGAPTRHWTHCGTTDRYSCGARCPTPRGEREGRTRRRLRGARHGDARPG